MRELSSPAQTPVQHGGETIVEAAHSEAQTPAPGSAAEAVVVIEPRRAWQRIDWRALWRYRELLVILAHRHISVRYQQTVLGATWAVLQPLLPMLAF